jgi:hypothetical protein
MIIDHDNQRIWQIISFNSLQDCDHITEKLKYIDFSVIQINATGEFLIPEIDDVSNFIAGILLSNDVLDFSAISRSWDNQRLISGNNI